MSASEPKIIIWTSGSNDRTAFSNVVKESTKAFVKSPRPVNFFARPSGERPPFLISPLFLTALAPPLLTEYDIIKF